MQPALQKIGLRWGSNLLYLSLLFKSSKTEGVSFSFHTVRFFPSWETGVGTDTLDLQVFVKSEIKLIFLQSTLPVFLLGFCSFCPVTFYPTSPPRYLTPNILIGISSFTPLKSEWKQQNKSYLLAPSMYLEQSLMLLRLPSKFIYIVLTTYRPGSSKLPCLNHYNIMENTRIK